MSRSISILIVITALLAKTGAGAGLQVTPGYKPGVWLESRQPFELNLSRALTMTDGRLAIFIDQTDITELFVSEVDKRMYPGDTLPLPAGEHELIVSVVTNGQWQEAGRFAIRVRTPHGLERAQTAPSLDLANKGQVGEGHRPLTNQPARSKYQDATIQAAINTEHQRGGLALRTTGRVVGVSYINESLRFSQKGAQAPRVDLSDYKIELQNGRTVLSLGNVAYGNLRHLVNSFASRGALLTWKVGRAADFQIAALNGTSIAGWDNFLGIGDRQHQVLGATAGFELVPGRAGALRLESTLFSGSVHPLTNFNQGAIRSGEKSGGSGYRLVASTPQQRFVIDGGYTTSEFRNAPDPQLEEGLNISAIPSRRRKAFYADTSIVMVRDRLLFRQSRANVVFAYHVEKVDPLYRSLGASIQPDVLRHAGDVTFGLGSFSARITHARSEDNVDGIRSILKTKTRRTEVSVGVPLGVMTGRKGIAATLLPVVAITFDLTHQFGASLPVDSDFSASHVPDQVSMAGAANADWQIGQYVRASYRFSRADQDNRQTGRELSDLHTRGHAVSLGVAITDRLGAGLDASLDEAFNREQQKTDWVSRIGANLNWKFFGDTGIGGNVSKTRGHNDLATAWNNGFDSYLELFSGFPLGRFQRQKARIFVRYSNRSSSSVDRIFNTDTDQSGWAMTTGATVTLR